MAKILKKRHGAAWWIFIGWWWVPVLFVYYIIPKFIIVKIWGTIQPEKKTKTPAPAAANDIRQIQGSGLVRIHYYGYGDASKRNIGYVEAKPYSDHYTITERQYDRAAAKCQAAGLGSPHFKSNMPVQVNLAEIGR